MKHNWEYKRLGEVCAKSQEIDVIPFDKNKFWLLNLDRIEKNSGQIISIDLVARDELDGSITSFSSAHILYSKLRPNLNKVVIPNHSGYCTTELVPILPTKDIKREYLWHYLRGDIFVTYICNKTAGAKMPRVKMSDFWEYSIPVPPLSVQEQIVVELDKINELIADHREMLTQLDALAQSLFYDTFGDPITNPKGWGIKKLSEVSDINGKYINDKNNIDLIDYLPMEDLNIGKLYINPIKLKTADERLSSYTSFVEGDVLLAKVTPCFENGKVGIVRNLKSSFGVGSSEFLVFRPRKYINPIYLCFIFKDYNFIEKGKHNLKGSSGLRRLSRSFIDNYPIPLPPLALQQSFARKIEAIEAQKADIEASIAELQTLLDSRMDYWFN